MFFETNILYSVLEALSTNSTAFLTRTSSNDMYEEVIEMSYIMDPNTGEQVNRLIFGESLKPKHSHSDRNIVSMIGTRVRIYNEKNEVYGGQPHQDLLDFGLSDEEIKLLKIIFRLVRKMASEK